MNFENCELCENVKTYWQKFYNYLLDNGYIALLRSFFGLDENEPKEENEEET
ncbi:MAG: hypothetical protein Fur0024_0240 [Patescibacteria group bacterium]